MVQCYCNFTLYISLPYVTVHELFVARVHKSLKFHLPPSIMKKLLSDLQSFWLSNNHFSMTNISQDFMINFFKQFINQKNAQNTLPLTFIPCLLYRENMVSISLNFELQQKCSKYCKFLANFPFTIWYIHQVLYVLTLVYRSYVKENTQLDTLQLLPRSVKST